MDIEWIISTLLEAIVEKDWELVQQVIDYIQEEGQNDLYISEED
jgi:uncharacterized protein YjaG (DUF416 family)